MQSDDRSLPVLTPEEVRVLACLVEKELTTPDNYPLTLNTLVAACNQKTSRDPVVEYDAATVEQALQGLKERGLARFVSGAEHRVPKFKHDMPFLLRLSPAQTAVLTVLMLRGPQTIGEIRGRTDRMHTFDSFDEVADVLRDLQDHLGRRLVAELERLPGTKEPRYAHLLCGEQEISTAVSAAAVRSATTPRVGEMAELREEVSQLREEIALLKQEFADFRKQFE